MLSDYLPNKLPLGHAALVALKNNKPVTKAFQQFSAFQLIGGKGWTLSIIKFKPIDKWEKGD